MHSIGYGGKRIRISSGFRVIPSDWNKKKQSFRASVSGFETKNELLRKHSTQIEEVFNKAILRDYELTKEYFAKSLPFSSGFEKEKGVLDYFDEYISFSEKTKAKATIAVFRTTKKHVSDFSIKYRYKLTFQSFNNDFYEKFFSYIIEDRGLFNNAFGKYVKTIKSFLTWALDKDIHRSREYSKFKVYKESNEPLPLSMEELKKIEGLTLNDALDRVRDLFLMECYTGLRYSDLIELRKENIKGDFIHKVIRKTKNPIKVPMTKKVKAILEKYAEKINGYDLALLPGISNQKMNKDLKEICDKAEMHDEIILSKFKGAVRHDRQVRKCDAITTHCGRDTFITNSLMMGMSESTIMTIVGHVKYETFKKYVKFKDQYLSDEMKVWDTK